MYAIIETGGKQFRVQEGSRLHVEKIDAAKGDEVRLDKVLMLGGGTFSVGTPYIAGAAVTAEVVEQGRGEKVIIFKKRRRHDSRRKQGHRQDYTTIAVKSITA